MNVDLKKKACIALSVLLLLILFVACGTSLKGIYQDDMGRTIKFENRKSGEFQGIPMEYKISNGTITIVFDATAANSVQQYSFEQMDNSILIDGVQYKKAN